MGIHRLQKYIYNRHGDCIESYMLHDTWLIVDGGCVSNQMMEKMRQNTGVFFEDYDIYGWKVEQFYRTLKLCNITPIVVLDGISENLPKYMTTYTEQEKVELKRDGNLIRFQPFLLPEVFRDITRKMGVQLVRCVYEADNSIAALAKTLDCPVLSCDSDFYLYGVKYVNYDSLSDESTKWAGGHALSCQIYRIEKLLSKFGALHESFLPLAQELLKTKFMSSVGWEYFHQTVAKSTSYAIPNTLSWLTNFSSLNEAIGTLLRYIRIDLRREIVERLEKNISRFAVPSESILQFVVLDQNIIDSLKEKKDTQRFIFQRRVGMPAVTQRPELVGKTRSTFSNEGNESFSPLSEDELIAAAPNWWLRDFSTGILRGTVIKVFIYYFRSSKLKTNSAVFPPIRATELPVIIRMFELIISSMKEERLLLRVRMRDGDQEVRDIVVEKWPTNLSKLRNSGVTERRKVINEILGIKNEKNLEKLPAKWRLYVATIIYWHKHKYEYLSTDVHLFSLLFTMLVGVVDDKVGFYRPVEGDVSAGELGDCNFIGNEEPSELNNNEMSNEHSEPMNMVDCLTREDCAAVYEIFRSNLINTGAEAEIPANLSTDCIDIFRQFQRSLLLMIQLNAMLAYPYTTPPVHELYSGSVLYNVFDELSKSEDMNYYIEKTLEKAPKLLSVFEILENTVMDELEENYFY